MLRFILWRVCKIAKLPKKNDLLDEKERNWEKENRGTFLKMECPDTPLLPYRSYKYLPILITTHIQNEVQKFGFKASRSKPAMISLLEECWKASQQPTTPKTLIPSSEDISSPALLLRVHTRITEIIKS